MNNYNFENFFEEIKLCGKESDKTDGEILTNYWIECIPQEKEIERKTRIYLRNKEKSGITGIQPRGR